MEILKSWKYSGVQAEGCGVTIEGFAPAEAVATPPAEDTKARYCFYVAFGRSWPWIPLDIVLKIRD